MPHKLLVDLTGRKFGSWTALSYDGRGYWRCRCDCGAEGCVLGRSLRHGGSSRCRACFDKNRPQFKHGGNGTRLYRAWHSAICRCENKKQRCYPAYGGRGISVCAEWRHDFVAFRKWALENGYADNLTLERKDVNKGYSPGNCSWVTKGQQARNRQSHRWVEHQGRKWLFSELAEKYGIHVMTLKSRVLQRGWPLECALLTPTIERKRHVR